jgi:hypothetical protein
MFQDAMDLTDTGLLELRRRLEAYADARLTPSLDATIRMRMNVMSAAHRRAALIAADDTFDAAGATITALAAAQAETATYAWRRPAAAIFAGCLTLALLVGTALAAKPGGPLYAARIWTEMANLPAGIVARADAEVGRLDARIQEAQQASTAGDGPAVEAALTAYSVIVIEAADGTAGDPTARAAIEIAVSRHVVILAMLVDSVPPQARAALQNALSASTKVLDDLDGAGQHGNQGRPGDADVSRGRRPDGTKPDLPIPANGTSVGVGAGQTGKPDKTAKPADSGQAGDHATPRPAQNGSGGASKNDATARPTGPPPDHKPAGPDKDGGP